MNIRNHTNKHSNLLVPPHGSALAAVRNLKQHELFFE